MACRYTYQGKTYEAFEFDDVLKSLAPDIAAKYMSGVQSIPAAPFVNKTEAWTALALKRMIRYAAENGFSKVAWASGEQQAARYDLSKQVDSIKVEAVDVAEPLHFVDIKMAGGKEINLEVENGTVREGEFSGKSLDEIIGKDMADKILAIPQGEFKKFSGLDLKLGGEGMKGFYDKIVPNVANDVLKKLGGGRVESVTMDLIGAKYRQGQRADEAIAEMLNEQNGASQPGFTITPKMREIANEGLPLFSPKSNDEVRREAEFKTFVSLYRDDIQNRASQMRAKVALWKAEGKFKYKPGDVVLGLKGKTFKIAGYSIVGRRISKDPAREKMGEPGYIMQSTDGTITFDAYASAVDKYPLIASDDIKFSPKQTETAAFKKWFGNSKVVDADGKPLVVYHGGRTDGDGIRRFYYGSHFGTTVEQGEWRIPTMDPESPKGEAVYPAYLAISNPIRLDDKGGWYGRSFVQYLKGVPELKGVVFTDSMDADRIFNQIAKAGFDGIVYKNRFEGHVPEDSWIAFKPEQIKSAVGNNGKFDPNNPDIRFAPKQTPSVPQETKLEGARRVAQDSFLRFKVLQDWLAESGIKLSSAANVYRTQGLWGSRAATRIEDFREKTWKPLIKKAEAAGVTLDRLSLVMHARHALERNPVIAKINPKFPDGGAGMSNQAAKDILKTATKDEKQLAAEFQSITNSTRAILLRSGLISQDMHDAWEASYKSYVPLKGTDEVLAGTGKGYSVSPKLKRALGHQVRDEAILENIMRDHERAVILAEKNRVGVSLLQFALEANNPELVTIAQPIKRAVLKPDQAVYEVSYDGGVLDTLYNLKDARVSMQGLINSTGMDAKKFSIAKVQGDPKVQYMASPKLEENEAAVYINGAMVRMQLNDEMLARAYKNLGIEHVNAVFSIGRAVNNYLSKVYTAYNPEFLQTNMTRDFISGNLNTLGNYGVGVTAKVIAGYPAAFGKLFRYAWSGGKAKDAAIEEYRAEGGSTGAAWISDLERIGTNVKRAYDDYAGVLATAKSGRKAAALQVASDKTISALTHLFEVMNQVGENAYRLSIYRTLTEAGYERAEAALAAKDSTVNFNRKGEIANQVGALYLFYNPAVQGAERMIHAMTASPHRGQVWAALGSMTVLAFLLAQMNADADKKRWEETPEYDKAHNLIIPAGDRQIKIAMPYEYGFFNYLGYALHDLVSGKKSDVIGYRLASAFLESNSPIVNPLGDKAEATNLVQLLPTMLRIPGEMVTNRSRSGTPIQPDKTNPGKPDSANMFRTTMGTPFEKVATAMNRVTGGSTARAGNVDVSPESLKYLFQAATGGAGNFLISTGVLGNLYLEGATPETREIPFVRRVIREATVADTRRAFRSAAEEVKKAQGEMQIAKQQLERAAKSGDSERADEARRLYRSMATGQGDLEDIEGQLLSGMGKALMQFNKVTGAKRDAIDAIQADKKLSLAERRIRVKEIEVEEQRLYNRFLDIFNARREQARLEEMRRH